MIALLCPDRRYDARIRRAIAPGEQVAPADGWSGLELMAGSAECSILLIEWLSYDEDYRLLERFKHRLPDHPVIVVTREDADNARFLKGVLVEEVVWTGRIDEELPAAISRARSHGLSCVVARRIEAAGHIDPKLREALVFAWRSARPHLSMVQLASTVGCDRSTLWRYWHEAVGPGAEVRLEDFLDWVVLFHAAAWRTPCRSWAAAAAHVGVHEHTLVRLARRLMGSTLREIGIRGERCVVQHFERTVLRSLLRSAVDDLGGKTTSWD